MSFNNSTKENENKMINYKDAPAPSVKPNHHHQSITMESLLLDSAITVCPYLESFQGAKSLAFTGWSKVVPSVCLM